MADKYIYLTEYDEDELLKQPIDSGTEDWAYPTGSRAFDYDPVHNLAFVSLGKYSGSSVVKINGELGSAEESNGSIPGDFAEGKISDIEVDEDTKTVCVAGHNKLKKYDYDLNQKGGEISYPGNFQYPDPTRGDTKDGRIFLGSTDSWMVADLADESIVQSGNGGSLTTFGKDNSTIYIGNEGAASIKKYDLSTGTVEWSTSFPGYLSGLDYNAGELFTTYSEPDEMRLQDAENGSVVWKRQLGRQPNGALLGGTHAIIPRNYSNVRFYVYDRSNGSGVGSYPTDYGGGASNWAAGDNFTKVSVQGTIRRAVDGGELEGAQVTIGDSSSLSDGSGSFTIASDPGNIEVKVTHPDYQTETRTVDASGGATENFNLSAKPAQISGTIRDANGDAVQGAEVVDNFGNSATTDANGSYTVQSPPWSEVDVFGLEGYSKHSFTTGAGSQFGNNDFQYGGATVAVEAPDGSTIAGAEVIIGDKILETDASGTVSYLTMPPADHPVYIQRSPTEVTLSPNSGETVDYSFEAGKMAKLTLVDDTSDSRIRSLPTTERTGGAVARSNDDGKADVLLFDGSKDMDLLVSDGDRRYQSVGIKPDLPNGEIYEAEIRLERRVAVTNR